MEPPAASGITSSAERAQKRGWRSWNAGERATVVGTVAGTLSLVVAIGAWQWPKSQPPAVPPAMPSHQASPGRTPSDVSPSGTTPSSQSTPDAEFLDSAFTAESGGDHLTAVPRSLRSSPAYETHPVAIVCPSNQTGHQAHDVTYPIRGRYVDFYAEVRPYYPPGADNRSAIHLTVLVETLQRDGELRSVEAGKYVNATPTTPEEVSVPVDNAEKLTIRVECQSPRGTVILTNARLIPA